MTDGFDGLDIRKTKADVAGLAIGASIDVRVDESAITRQFVRMQSMK
ncbi:hypothetical protein [Burkholderia sp. 22313]